MTSVVGDRNPGNQDSRLGTEVRTMQSARTLPTYPQALLEPMVKGAFDPRRAVVVELAAMQVSQTAHIDRTSSFGRYSAVLQREAAMGLVVVGHWGTVCCTLSAMPRR
jgi:hypothetical protein